MTVTTQLPRRISAVLCCALLAVAAAGGPCGAQENTAPPDPNAARGSGESEESSGIHPDAVSSFQVREYQIREKKLWKGLIQTLQQSGYPPEEVDEKALRLKTSFVDFSSRDYSEEVAEAPPRIGPTYHVLQMTKVKEGKVSLEAVVTRGEKGSVLSLRARILVQGLEQIKKIRVLVDRRSSGVIESDFLQKMEDTLELHRVK